MTAKGRRVRRALGVSVHTGWAACVVVGASLEAPEIAANQVVHFLGQEERFCYHMAADMERAGACAIVAKDGDPGELDELLRMLVAAAGAHRRARARSPRRCSARYARRARSSSPPETTARAG